MGEVLGPIAVYMNFRSWMWGELQLLVCRAERRGPSNSLLGTLHSLELVGGTAY
jgi:hypothetical protein